MARISITEFCEIQIMISEHASIMKKICIKDTGSSHAEAGNFITQALTRIPLPIDIKIRKVTYMWKEGGIPINIHEAEQLKPYTSSGEYIFCLLMRKCLNDKWLQRGVSPGQRHTEQLR